MSSLLLGQVLSDESAVVSNQAVVIRGRLHR